MMIEDELRRHFENERATGIPPFDTMWRAAEREAERRAPRRPLRWLVPIAAASLLIATLSFLLARDARPRAIPITSWDSPTASLLETPANLLTETVPSLGQSAIPMQR